MPTVEADSLIIAISYELKPQEGLTTFDMLQDPEFAKEQARLQYVRPYLTPVINSLYAICF